MTPSGNEKNSSRCANGDLTGWRRLLPFHTEVRGGRRRTRIRTGRLLVVLGIAAGAGYLTLAAGAFVFIKYSRGVSELTFLDLAWPSRWAHYRVVTGDHLIAIGQRQLGAGEFQSALTSLRIGVAKSPGNRSGRVALFQLLLAARRPDVAERVLVDGLNTLSQDPVYLQTLFGFLLQQQSDAQVRRIAAELLATRHLSEDCAAVATLAAASANYFRGNFDRAEDLLQRPGIAGSHDGRLLAAQIDWDRGYHELALVRLRALTEDFPTSEACQTQLGTWLREAGARDEYRRLCLLRRIANPDLPAPRIAFLYALHEDGRTEEVTRETEALLKDFPANESALTGLADFAANTGDPRLARRIYDLCRERHLAWEAPAFLTVEALIVARDYRGALDLTRDLLGSNPDWAKRYYTLFNSLQAIAHFGLHDDAAAQLYLENFLGQTDLRADNLLAVAQRFVDVGARNEARLVLAHAVVADPLNQAALTRLVSLEVDLEQLDTLPADLRRLIGMRKPSPDVLRAAAAKLGSDLFIFSRERDAALQAVQTALDATSRAGRS